MIAPTKTPVRIAGEGASSCNCAWGCPCQFNALPTHGSCEAMVGFQIRAGYFGSTRLDRIRFARIAWWPGAIHEGNGTRQLIIDEQATPDQRAALLALDSGIHGVSNFEIMSLVCPNKLEPIFAPITFRVDRERRQSLLHIPGIGESRAEPIKNPVTGKDHRALISLPNGLVYKEAEMANAVLLRVQADAPLVFEHANTYASMFAFNWSNEGS